MSITEYSIVIIFSTACRPYTKKTNSGVSSLSYIIPQLNLMDRKEIRKAASELTDRFSLLVLLNRVKKADLGDKAHPFTIAQLNYFCHPTRNAKYYVSFTIPKKSGKLREISAPNQMLKSFLTYMNVILQAMYEPTDAAMGFVPGRSVVDNARKHVGMNYVLNLDLENFFPSIPQARVWGALKSKAVGFNQGIANAVAALCCTEMTFVDGKPVLMAEAIPEDAITEKRCVLPQGAPTSPILTNIICRNLDRKLSALARHYGLNYTRYADDITFSSLHNVYQKEGAFMKALYETIKGENFSVNAAKTRLQVKGMRQEVTGLVVSDRVNVTRDYVRSIASLLYIWKRYGYDSAVARFLINYKGNGKGNPTMERVLQGKLMYLKMVKGEDNPIVSRLIAQYDELISKKPEKKADLDYVSSYKMPQFEKHISSKVRIFEKSAAEGKEASVGAICDWDGQELYLSVSDTCKKILLDAMSSGDDKQVEAAKQKMYVSYCNNRGIPYWLIMKTRPSVRYAKSKYDDLPKIPEISDAQDLLAELVDSNFDLNVLDKWDMTENI